MVMWHQNDSGLPWCDHRECWEAGSPPPQKEFNIMIDLWPCLVYGIRKHKDGVDPTLDDQIVMVSETGLHQTHWLYCVHVVVYHVSIIHMQSLGSFNQDATEYRNTVQACIGTKFTYSPVANNRKHRGLLLKEEGCNNSKFIRTQKYKNHI